MIIDKQVYEKIAKKYETTQEEVKNEMQKALNTAYLNEENQPTIEEFILTVAEMIKKWINTINASKLLARLKRFLNKTLRSNMVNC